MTFGKTALRCWLPAAALLLALLCPLPVAAASKAKPVKYTVPPFFTVRARCTGAGAASSGVSSTV